MPTALNSDITLPCIAFFFIAKSPVNLIYDYLMKRLSLPYAQPNHYEVPLRNDLHWLIVCYNFCRMSAIYGLVDDCYGSKLDAPNFLNVNAISIK